MRAWAGWVPLLAVVLAGCESSRPLAVRGLEAERLTPPPVVGELTPVQHLEEVSNAATDLDDLTRLALQTNPRLAQVGWAVETARGQAIQAGLYPNPVLEIAVDELADRTGPVGIWRAPFVSQEFVTHGKLRIAQAAANRAVDRATLAVVTERMNLLADVRDAYWDLISRETNAAVLAGLVESMKEAVEVVRKLEQAGETNRLAVLQLELDLVKDQAELESVRQSIPAARQRLAAIVGVRDLPAVTGRLDIQASEYTFDEVQAAVFAVSPELQSARVAVEQARLELQRAEVEPRPNITLSGGYMYQGQNRSNDLGVGVSLPMPVRDRNQGNIHAARAALAAAQLEVERMQNDIQARIAAAYGQYAEARALAERHQQSIVPKAEEVFRLALQSRNLGQLEYLPVLEAQRALADARKQLVESLAAKNKAKALLESMMLMEPAVKPSSE